MKRFVSLLSAQTLSLLGTQMTGFGVSVWFFSRTGSLTLWTGILFSGYAAGVLAAPLAGAIVDRFERRITLYVSNVAGAAVIAALVFLYFAHLLHPWTFLVTNAAANAVLSVQEPALVVTGSSMLPEAQQHRGIALMSLSTSLANVLAPALGGALYGIFGLGVLLIFDAVSYGVALAAVTIIPLASSVGLNPDKPRLREVLTTGVLFVRDRPHVRRFLIFVFVANLSLAFRLSLRTPLVLARTGNHAVALGEVQAIGMLGGVLAGVILAARKAQRFQMPTVIGGLLVAGLLGQCLTGVGRSVPEWSAGFFVSMFAQPFIGVGVYSIVQRNTAIALQGRMIAFVRFATQAATPIAVAVSGPLSDYVFKPMFRSNVSHPLRLMFGTGDGAGIGCLLFLSGIAAALSAIYALSSKSIRQIERDDWGYDVALPLQPLVSRDVRA